MYAGHFDYMFKHAKLPFQLVKKRKNVKFNTIKSWLTPSKTALIGFYSPEYTHICLAVQVKDDRLIIANYGRKAPALKAIDEAFFNTFMGKNVVYFVKKKDIALLPKKRQTYCMKIAAILVFGVLMFGVGYNSGFNNGRIVGEQVVGMMFCEKGLECKK